MNLIETQALLIAAAACGTAAHQRKASREPLFDRALDPIMADATLSEGQELFKAWLKAYDLADAQQRLLKNALHGMRYGLDSGTFRKLLTDAGWPLAIRRKDSGL